MESELCAIQENKKMENPSLALVLSQQSEHCSGIGNTVCTFPVHV